MTAKRTIETAKPLSKRRYNSDVFEKLVANFVSGTEAIFLWDWEHTKSCLEGDNMKYFISSNGDFLNPEVEDEGNNWANRVGYPDSYRKLKSFMDEYKMRKKQPFSDDGDDLPF